MVDVEKINAIQDPDEKKKFIDAEIERLEKVKNDMTSSEQAIKVTLNSMYGAIASPFFVAYSTEVAEAITLQGQDLIKYAERVINKYFLEVWHLDTDLHSKLGVTVEGKITREVTIYMDTDSAYVNFEDVLATARGWEKTGTDFILEIYKLRLKEYFQQCFKIYANRYNTENIQDFELESISESAIWLAKKKYVLDPSWKDPGVFIKPLTKMKPKGIEVVRGDTPPFARTKVIELLKHIMAKGRNFDNKEFMSIIKETKKEFKLSAIEDISKGSSVGDYEKYILSDRGNFAINKGCPVQVRAAGWYNYVLNGSKMKSKYVAIKTGDKIKWYYTKDPDNNVFGYLPNAYPIEIAPEIDHEKQFSMAIIEPINRFLVAIGQPPMDDSLVTINQLF